jgi:hypothetical protein
MVAGACVGSIGAGFATTLDVETSKVIWAVYLVVTGIGIGMAFQLPYTAVQTVLEYVYVHSFRSNCSQSCGWAT